MNHTTSIIRNERLHSYQTQQEMTLEYRNSMSGANTRQYSYRTQQEMTQ